MQEKSSIQTYVEGFVALLVGILGFLLFRKTKEVAKVEGDLSKAQADIKFQESDHEIKTQDAITQSALDAFRKSDSGK